MELTDTATIGTVAPLLVVFALAIVIFLAAVWFGLHVVAPRISRALDRAEPEDEQAGDRPD